MTATDLQAAVQAFAARSDCVAGVCGAQPLDEVRKRLEGLATPFVSRDRAKRIDPRRSLSGANSVVVLGMGLRSLEPPRRAASPLGDEPTGVLSTLGAYADYHSVLKNILAELVRELQTCFTFKYRIIVDGGGLDERALAVRAGLGFWGHSGMVISPVYGPFWYIGCLLTDIEYTQPHAYAPVMMDAHPIQNANQHPDIPRDTIASRCPDGCRLCVEACPGGAISPEGHGLDASKCISYLTQKQEPLTEEEAFLIGRNLYGCDLCRTVCPFGADTGAVETEVPLRGIITMDEAVFNERYGHTAMAWRGAQTLRRNAAAVLRNLQV